MKDRFLEVENSILYLEVIVFFIVLIEVGEKEMINFKNRMEVV